MSREMLPDGVDLLIKLGRERGPATWAERLVDWVVGAPRVDLESVEAELEAGLLVWLEGEALLVLLVEICGWDAEELELRLESRRLREIDELVVELLEGEGTLREREICGAGLGAVVLLGVDERLLRFICDWLELPDVDERDGELVRVLEREGV